MSNRQQLDNLETSFERLRGLIQNLSQQLDDRLPARNRGEGRDHERRCNYGGQRSGSDLRFGEWERQERHRAMTAGGSCGYARPGREARIARERAGRTENSHAPNRRGRAPHVDKWNSRRTSREFGQDDELPELHPNPFYRDGSETEEDEEEEDNEHVNLVMEPFNSRETCSINSENSVFEVESIAIFDDESHELHGVNISNLPYELQDLFVLEESDNSIVWNEEFDFTEEGNSVIWDEEPKHEETDLFGNSDALCEFTPKSVILKVPFAIQPWLNSEENVGNLLMVWKFCITFVDVLGLWPFTLDEFIQAFHDYDSRLLGEIHINIMKLIVKDIEDVVRTPSGGPGMNQYIVVNPEGGHPHIVQGAYM